MVRTTASAREKRRGRAWSREEQNSESDAEFLYHLRHENSEGRLPNALPDLVPLKRCVLWSRRALTVNHCKRERQTVKTQNKSERGAEAIGENVFVLNHCNVHLLQHNCDQ